MQHDFIMRSKMSVIKSKMGTIESKIGRKFEQKRKAKWVKEKVGQGLVSIHNLLRQNQCFPKQEAFTQVLVTVYCCICTAWGLSR